ncbi:MAG: SRPBCC family protein [Acidimicrobiales bacterium]|nr:SRPBCC family protein [Acidimicrobiales bacterium]HRW37675.1 SRPBCC family protein [Aquihabitans sp.]
MGRIRVSTTIDAPPSVVWEEVRHVERHVDWMADAVAIEFTSRRRSGVGTTFSCRTKVGPIRLTDEMEITEWRDGKVMGVRHVGLVTGTGRFTLTRARGGRTRFTWDERLRFPWWMGGPVGGVVGGRVMKRIWRRNLTVLKALVESGRA